MKGSEKDIWSQWLLHRRFGGDSQQMQAMLDYLYPVRDKILNHANLSDGDILLDIGCGDGLIAFGALEKNETSKVILSDISQDLLDHARSIAQEMQILNRCEFLLASADDLSTLADASVDVVATRSVLIFVSAKQRSFKEFYRVLKPKGRLSIFEPINRFTYPEPPHIFMGYDVTSVMEIAQKLHAVYYRIQPPDTDPMMDFDERDLITLAEEAGFREIHLELQVEIQPKTESLGCGDGEWETMLQTAGNPKIPTLEEALHQALTSAERERFVTHLRPLVEKKQGVNKLAVAYLWAVKS